MGRNFHKIVLGAFVFSLLILGIVAGYYYLLNSRMKKETSRSASLTSPNPNNLKREFTILYQKENDKEGRTVVYDYALGFGGVGKQTKGHWLYVVGIFTQWEEIAGSSDRYLVLTNPSNKLASEKIRIVYEGEPKARTRIGIEDLSKLQKGEEALTKIGLITDFSKEKIEKLIQPGDALLVFLETNLLTLTPEERKSQKPELILDKQNLPISHILALRRFDGSQVLGGKSLSLISPAYAYACCDCGTAVDPDDGTCTWSQSSCNTCAWCNDCDTCNTCATCNDCAHCDNCATCGDCAHCHTCATCQDCDTCQDCTHCPEYSCSRCRDCDHCNGCGPNCTDACPTSTPTPTPGGATPTPGGATPTPDPSCSWICSGRPLTCPDGITTYRIECTTQLACGTGVGICSAGDKICDEVPTCPGPGCSSAADCPCTGASGCSANGTCTNCFTQCGSVKVRSCTGRCVSNQCQYECPDCQGVPTPTPIPGGNSPVGWLDATDCNYFWGWAGDKDVPTQAIAVDFYANGPAGSGQFIGTTTANTWREKAVCEAIMGASGGICAVCTNDPVTTPPIATAPQCYHGFLSPTPGSLKDSASHSIYAYGINAPGTGGSNTLLLGCPKNVSCSYPVGGLVTSSATGVGIAGVEVQVDDNNLTQTRTATTNATGNWTIDNFVRGGDDYAVRVTGNIANPKTAPSGYTPPAKTTSWAWSWNYCIPGDTPADSLSYECQKAGSYDCGGANDVNVKQRCNFAYDQLGKISGTVHLNNSTTACDAGTHPNPGRQVQIRQINDPLFPTCLLTTSTTDGSYTSDSASCTTKPKVSKTYVVSVFDRTSTESCSGASNCGGSTCSQNVVATASTVQNFTIFPRRAAWFQTAYGDIHANTSVRSTIPTDTCTLATCSTPGGCCPYLSLGGGTSVNSPGVLSTSGSIFPSDNISVAPFNWQVSNNLEELRDFGGKYYNYNHFASNLEGCVNIGTTPSGKINPSVFNTQVDTHTYGCYNFIGLGFDSNNKIQITCAGGACTKAVVLYNNDSLPDITIDNAIEVAPGAFFALVSKQNIIFGNSLGGSNKQIEGVYIADGAIKFSNSTYQALDQFVGRGMFIADADLSGGETIEMNREYLDPTKNANFPSLTFEYKPEYLVNFPVNFGFNRFSWQEVAP